MATIPAPARTTPKYEAQIDTQLARAERRVRMLDLAAGLLLFAALSFAYAAVMVLLHWKLELTPAVRQVALLLYVGGAAAFLTWKVALPYRRPINPRYAALQLERTLPGSKNSVVNYVDLRGEELPAAVHGALGRRAAKDALHANLEQAIPGKSAGRAGGIAAAVGVAFLVLVFMVGFGDFFRLLGGVLVPTNPPPAPPVGPRNQIAVRLPVEGNATVPAGSAIDFAVRVEGELPADDSQQPRLVLTYPQAKEPVVRFMARPRTAGGDWVTAVSALEVRDGFTYHVAAGDAETPEYRVSVYFTPAVTKFVAVYHYRPYLGEPSLRLQVDNRRLEAWRGTVVELRVQTNSGVEKASIEMTGKDGQPRSVVATVAKDDPQAFEAGFTIEETGNYRVCFTPARGDKYRDPLAYEIIAVPDNPPHKVELTKPGFDIRLPANGLLKLEGSAEDDIGVKSVSLRMKLKDGAGLKDRPYRSDAELRLPGGGYLKTLEYKDAVDFKTIRNPEGKPLKAGDILEYWLEVRDACDFPRPKDVGESKHFFVTLTEPEKDPQKEKKERDAADKEKKDHEAKQDEQRRQEDKKRKEQQQQAQQDQKQEKGGNPDEAKKNPGDGQKNDSQKPGDQQNKVDGDRQNEMNKLNKEREENQRRGEEAGENGDSDQPPKPDQKQEPKGTGKGDKPNPAESKPAEQKQGGDKPGQEKNDKSEGKPEGKQGDNKEGGKGKESNKPGDQQGEGKDGGKEGPMKHTQAEGKGGNPKGADGMGGEKPGEAKNDAVPKPSPSASNSGEGKGGDPKGADSQQAKGKTGDTADAKPQGKEGASDAKVADGKPAGDAKGQQQPGKGGPPDATAKGGPKDMGQQDPGTARNDPGTGGQGEKKPAPGQGAEPNTATAKGEGDKNHDAGGDVSKIDAKAPSANDLKNLVKALKDGDQEQVGKALKKLDEIGAQSENPNTREFAKNLSDDLQKYADQLAKDEQGSGAPKGPAKPSDVANPEQHSASQKGGPGNSAKDQPGNPKEQTGDATAKRGTDKGPGRPDQRPDPKAPPGGKNDKDDPTRPTVKGPKSPFGRNDDNRQANNTEEPLQPGKRVNPLNQPNTTLQLEKFDRGKYQDREDRLVERPPQPRKDTTPATASADKQGEHGTLNNVRGGNTVKSTTTGDPVDAGRAPPPPGYGKTISEYSKKSAQTDADKR